MSELHINFDADHVPESERHNPHASEAFDWESVFASLDGEILEVRQELSEEEMKRLCAALCRLLAFVVGARDTQNRGRFASIGARAVAVLSIVTPKLVDESQSDIARAQGKSKQAVNALYQDAREFIRTLKNTRG